MAEVAAGTIQQPRGRRGSLPASCQGSQRERPALEKDCSSVGGPWPFDPRDVPDVPKWHVSSNKLHSQTGGRGLQITVRSEGICCDDPGLDGAHQRSPSRAVWQSAPTIPSAGVVTSSRVTAWQRCDCLCQSLGSQAWLGWVHHQKQRHKPKPFGNSWPNRFCAQKQLPDIQLKHAQTAALPIHVPAWNKDCPARYQTGSNYSLRITAAYPVVTSGLLSLWQIVHC